MEHQPIFRGVAVALVTLFRPDGELDASATAELAGRLVDLGVAAVLVAGTTGEAAALELAERQALLAAVREALPPSRGVPLIAGTGAASAHQAALLTQAARDGGADAVLALSPPHASDYGPYYEAVAKAAGDLPVLAYNFPKASPPGIPVSALKGLAVSGLKDSSGDADRLMLELSTWDRPVYMGSASLVALAGLLGCPGAILALANVEPEACVAAFGGDAAAQLKLAEVNEAASVKFPAGVKELVARRFGYLAAARMG